MKTLPYLLFIILASCTYGDGKHAIAFGGKGAYKGKEFALTWDNEDSFRVGAATAGVAISAGQAVGIAASNNALAKVKDTNAAGVANNASNNAAKVQLGAQNADTVKATTIPK